VVVSLRRKIIRVQWATPRSVDDAIDCPESLLPGLYYITHVWGDKERSLYIGKASNTIRERLRSHKKEWLYRYQRGKMYVRLGHIIYPREVDSELIDHAESALIFENQDILRENTDKRGYYSYTELYRVENIGDIGGLKETADMYEHPDQ